MTSLPLLVLEKVFSYLDWKDLGTVMLVCQRWSDVGGHPSLWTGFPLQLAGTKLDSFSKLRRLGWIRSATITPLPGKELENLKTIVHHFSRMEELFVNEGENGAKITGGFLVKLLRLQEAKNNRLVRFGFKRMRDSDMNENLYCVPSCDTDTNAFVRKTLTCEKNDFVFIFGQPGVHLSYEILETLSRNRTRSSLIFTTNLMIGQNIEVSKLTEFLKHHVKFLSFVINPEDLENQKVAPINAILDLLGSENHGVFRLLKMPKELFLKSHWAERLGELANGEENGAVLIERTKSGLKLST